MGWLKLRVVVLLYVLSSGAALSQVPDTISVPGLRVNPYPRSMAPPHTSGNSSVALISESQIELPNLWRILFQPHAGATHDALSAIVEPTPGTTSIQLNAVAGYVHNLNPASQAKVVGVGVALGGYTINAVDGAQSWGLDLIQTDAQEAQGGSGRLLQNEADFKPLFENTTVNGFILAMDSPIQPKVADGWICGKTSEGGGSVPSGVGRWNHCVITYAGAAITAFMAGAASAAGTRLSDSQNVDFQVTDEKGAFHNLRLRATNDHYLVLQRDDAGVADLDLVNGNLLLQAGHGVYVAGRPLVGGPVPASATSPCSPGAMTSDSTYIYSCVAENTWKRAPLSGW